MQTTKTDFELRPLIHFTPQQGFMNDPNGLCKYKDTYFLFFQHNPTEITHGNTHWGMAVSTDLLHWQQRAPAILPDDADGFIFSGSGIVDHCNCSRLKNGPDDPILLFYTGTGFRTPPKAASDKEAEPEPRLLPATRQCIAYSLDGGQTFVKYTKNPILPQYAPLNRDPKVNYVPEADAFAMALYLKDNRFKLFWSENLLEWVEGQELELPGCAECPDLFRLKVDGNPDSPKWVLFASPENYVLGHFQGRVFMPETSVIVGSMARAFGTHRAFTDCPAYAPQTFYAPQEDRVIQLSWIPTHFPGMPFQGQMSLPWELELVTTPEGIRLKKQPAAEAEHLRKREIHCTATDCAALNESLRSKETSPFRRMHTEAKEMCLDAVLGNDGRLTFAIRGVVVSYDHKHRRLLFPTGEYSLPIYGNKLDLRIIVDRGSVELFACQGLFNCVLNTPLDTGHTEVEFYALEHASADVRLYELGL